MISEATFAGGVSDAIATGKEAVFDFSSKHWPMMLSFVGVLVALFCLRAWAFKKQQAADYDNAHPIFKPSDHRRS